MNSTEEIWRQSIIQESSIIDQAIRNLEKSGIKIVLVVDNANKLLGTISDGDIRRGLLMTWILRVPLPVSFITMR